MLYPETCIIMPTRTDARIAANWLKSCELRGFRTDDSDDALVVFSGYGATHDSARRYFKLKYITNCFIVQKNGNISLENIRSKTCNFDKYFEKSEIEFFLELAKLAGNESPLIIPME
jgi:hypothetical protein